MKISVFQIPKPKCRVALINSKHCLEINSNLNGRFYAVIFICMTKVSEKGLHSKKTEEATVLAVKKISRGGLKSTRRSVLQVV